MKPANTNGFRALRDGFGEKVASSRGARCDRAGRASISKISILHRVQSTNFDENREHDQWRWRRPPGRALELEPLERERAREPRVALGHVLGLEQRLLLLGGKRERIRDRVDERLVVDAGEQLGVERVRAVGLSVAHEDADVGDDRGAQPRDARALASRDTVPSSARPARRGTAASRCAAPRPRCARGAPRAARGCSGHRGGAATR